MKPIDPLALFRLSVLGPLASRERFKRGELKEQIRQLAQQRYDIPGSKNCYLSEKVIEAWYYRWLKGGIEALAPKPRRDRHQSKLSVKLQAAVIACKQDNPQRSINEIKRCLEDQGIAAKSELSRSSIHRLLCQHGLSRPPKDTTTLERRSYEATHAGDLWVGDVMHGPTLMLDGKRHKVYLVSLMDDASRLLTHSAFCLGETALDIEGVFKQAILRRGLPKKLVVDQGAAYRAQSFQTICARLEVRLIYCRPYDPQSKGKLERYHRLFRQQFLSELQHERITQLADLNARLWAWLETVYHTRPHGMLEGMSPLERYQQDLVHIRPLRLSAEQYDQVFYHRLARKVRKDATVSYEGDFYEVPFSLTGKKVMLVVDPHRQVPTCVESVEGEPLGAVTPLDYQANAHRRRHRPATPQEGSDEDQLSLQFSTVERALEKRSAALTSPVKKAKPKPKLKR